MPIPGLQSWYLQFVDQPRARAANAGNADNGKRLESIAPASEPRRRWPAKLMRRSIVAETNGEGSALGPSSEGGGERRPRLKPGFSLRFMLTVALGSDTPRGLVKLLPEEQRAAN